ncbi:hypothetical protein Q7P35_001428 [Cladosporium inversicolor]
MPLLDWLTKHTGNLFPQQLYHTQQQEGMGTSTSTSTINPTRTQTQPTPTLSFDLSAPTSSGSAWTVNHVWGGDGTDTFAKQLQDILNRTETFSILNDLFYRHIVAVLVVIWSVVLWRKAKSVGMTRFGWQDALAVLVCVGSAVWRNMPIAIGVTAGYAAWAVLADRPWNGKGGLPGFEVFVKGLKPAEDGNAQDAEEQSEKTETQTATPSAEPDPAAAAEATLLTRIEANLGLPEKKPHEDCVVCWSSSPETPPLKLPCSHLVCSDCLLRLKDANRYTCPFCRTPLYTLTTNKATLFQLVAFSSGAQLALALTLAALRFSRGRYWGAAGSLIFKGWPAAGTLWSQWGIRKQGEEGYFASTSEGNLQVQLALSGYLLYAVYGGMDQVGWATFVDGRLVRGRVDEGEFLRAVLCWAVPGLAGRVVRCS